MDLRAAVERAERMAVRPKGSTSVVIPGPTWAAVLRALREGAE